MIPAYSPQARGHSERNFGTWQGRLPGVRLAGIGSMEAANRFLREHYIAEFDRRFQVAAAQRGQRLCAVPAIWILPSRCSRATLAGCQVTAHQHLDGTLSITRGLTI